MANHKSAIKRIRQSEKKRLLNKYFHKTTRNAMTKLKDITDKKEVEKIKNSIENGGLLKIKKAMVILTFIIWFKMFKKYKSDYI